MEALEGMDGIDLSPGGGSSATITTAPNNKDVLQASKEVLPNRSPFEMQYELFKRGMELEDDDNFLGAEKQWTEIIENFNSPNFRTTNPGNKVLLARAYSNRGNTRLTLQKTREAILDYSESIDLVPEKGEFWLARGVAFEVCVLYLYCIVLCSIHEIRTTLFVSCVYFFCALLFSAGVFLLLSRHAVTLMPCLVWVWCGSVGVDMGSRQGGGSGEKHRTVLGLGSVM